MFRLENMGFTVLGVCCDGLAANRQLFSLHCPGSGRPVHKVVNPHAHDGEKIYFFFLSDPPHLIKRVRNCWANYKQNIWVCKYSVIMLFYSRNYYNYYGSLNLNIFLV